MNKGHIPVRTCISCRSRRNRSALVRLMLDEKGRVVRDEDGRGTGRGAYVCRSAACLERLREGNRLARAFRMAKVRVYELARELDIESKALVQKLLAGGLPIKNYMSTLDEEAVRRAREIVAGVVSEVVEEKRIKATVIRRRRKKIRVEPKPAAPESEEIAPAAESPVEETAAPVTESPETAVVPEETAAKAEMHQEEAPPEEAPPTPGAAAGEVPAPGETPPKPAAEAAEKVAKPKKKKGEKAARIIKRPEEGPLKDLLAKKADGAGVLRPRKSAPSRVPPVAKRPFPAPAVPDAGAAPGKAVGKKKAKKWAGKAGIPGGKGRRHKKEIYEKADLYQGRSLKRKSRKGGKEARKKVQQTQITVPKAIKRRLRIQESVTVSELAKAMGIKAAELIKRLLILGVPSNINQSLDFETATLVADEFGYELELDSFDEASLIPEPEDRPEDLVPRPPVVTIMGHVDHGKTSLLDYIRKSNIIGGESGGITQHIGAYFVKTDGGDIVFLDTPGHEAFTAMRARGAEVTDLIVLVVAADDGVMPQTKEAVNHARAADIPIVVAVNKIDKPDADPERVKRELAELNLTPEEWGGDTIFGHISAKTGEGVDELLSLILLQAEVLELKGNPNKPARGTIIEARLDKSKGPLATVLIKNGTLRKGDYFVCGEHHGRVRAMNSSRGTRMKSAGPSMPVEIYGISGVPMAGDIFVAVPDEKTAKQVSENRRAKSRKQEVARKGMVSLDDLFERIKEGGVKELNIVLKTDVQGSAGLLEPVYEERIIGRADIKEIFHVPKVGSVAGCLVSEGHVQRNAKIRLLRDNVVVFDGKIASLRRFKEDAKEVQSGYECGIGLENFQDIKPGDVFEVYEVEEVEAEL